MDINLMPVLLKREFQEHRAALFITPIVVTAFLSLIILFFLYLLEFSSDTRINGEIRFGDEEEIVMRDAPLGSLFAERLMAFAGEAEVDKERKLDDIFRTAAKPMLFTLWVVVFFYLLGTLYDERKDRSILFWKSMPVSDALTVLSKLLVAILVAPGIYMIGVIVVQLVLILTASVALIGYPVESGEILWGPANLIGRWLEMIGYFLFTGLWCLPFYGWVLLVSAFARSIPFVWVVGIPIGVVVIERIFFMDSVVGGWMERHVVSIDALDTFDLSGALSRLASLEFLISFAVGIALLYGAVLMRGRGDEI